MIVMLGMGGVAATSALLLPDDPFWHVCVALPMFLLTFAYLLTKLDEGSVPEVQFKLMAMVVMGTFLWLGVSALAWAALKRQELDRIERDGYPVVLHITATRQEVGHAPSLV